MVFKLLQAGKRTILYILCRTTHYYAFSIRRNYRRMRKRSTLWEDTRFNPDIDDRSPITNGCTITYSTYKLSCAAVLAVSAKFEGSKFTPFLSRSNNKRYKKSCRTRELRPLFTAHWACPICRPSFPSLYRSTALSHFPMQQRNATILHIRVIFNEPQKLWNC